MVCIIRPWPCLHRLPQGCRHDASTSALGCLLLPHDHHAGTGHTGTSRLWCCSFYISDCSIISSWQHMLWPHLSPSLWVWRPWWHQWLTCTHTWFDEAAAESCCCCWCALSASWSDWSWSHRYVTLKICVWGVCDPVACVFVMICI